METLRTNYPWNYLSFRLKTYTRFTGISLSPALDLNRPNYSYWESHSYESTQTNRLLLPAGKYVQGIAKGAAFPVYRLVLATGFHPVASDKLALETLSQRRSVHGIEPISHEQPAALPAGGQRPFLPLFLLISSGMLR